MKKTDLQNRKGRDGWIERSPSLSHFYGDWWEGENIGTKASEGTLRNTMNSFVVNGYQSFSLWLFLCNFHKRGYIYLDSDLEKILLGWVVMSFWLALM